LPNFLKVLYDVFLDVQSRKEVFKIIWGWVWPQKSKILVFTTLKAPYRPHIDPKNFFQDFSTLVCPKSNAEISNFRRYFFHGSLAINIIWHEKIFPKFYNGPMTAIYQFWKFHVIPSIILDFRFHGFNAKYTFLKLIA